jgi:hypothetical protein
MSDNGPEVSAELPKPLARASLIASCPPCLPIKWSSLDLSARDLGYGGEGRSSQLARCTPTVPAPCLDPMDTRPRADTESARTSTSLRRGVASTSARASLESSSRRARPRVGRDRPGGPFMGSHPTAPQSAVAPFCCLAGGWFQRPRAVERPQGWIAANSELFSRGAAAVGGAPDVVLGVARQFPAADKRLTPSSRPAATVPREPDERA